MAQTSFPFENVDTTETQFSQMFRTLNAGVNGTPAGTELKVTAGTGLAVSIAAGQAMVRGHYYISTAAETLALTAANGSNPRIDAIVLTLDPTANTVILAKVDGTPASSPVAPTLTQTDAGVFQYLLATVLVPAGATVPSTITDSRGFMGSRFGLWATAGRPTSPTVGQVGFNTTLNAAEFYNGSAWVLVGAAPNTNYVANGDFSKWSRGTTFTDTSSAITLTGPDRWNIYGGTTGRTITKQDITSSVIAGARYALRYQRDVGNSSTTAGYLSTAIGTADSLRFAGKTATLSFYARAGANYSASSGNLTAQVRSGTGIDENPNSFTNQAFPLNSIVSLTTSWQRFTITGTIASNATELAVWFNPTPVGTAGAADYFEVTGVQFEEGTVASDFKPAGGNKALDTVTSGSAGFDGVLVSTNSASNPSGSGTPAWAGFDVAGKNKIINGGFDFWQRGTSSSSSGYVSADRYYFSALSASGYSASRQAFTPGSAPVAGYESQYYCDIAGTLTDATNGVIQFSHGIEDVRTFAGQAVTLSFFAKASAAGTIGAVLQQQFQSASGAIYGTQTTFNITTSWARYSVTFNVASVAGKTIGANSFLNLIMTKVAGSAYVSNTGAANLTGTLSIWGVQLEAGSVATPFSRAGGTLQGELAACQRYYQLVTTGAFTTRSGNSTIADGTIVLPVTMRATPTTATTTVCKLDNAGVANYTQSTVATAISSLSSPYAAILALSNFTGLPTPGVLLSLRSDGGGIPLNSEL